MRSRTVMSLGLTWALAVQLAGASASAGSAAEGETHAAGGKTVLATGSYWRWHMTWRKPVVSAEALRRAGRATTQPVVLPVKIPYRDRPGIATLQTPAPPAGWARPGFDDARWPRARGPFPKGTGHFQTAMLCLRGKFTVTDPAAVKALPLRLTYRGGVIVYLNGVEVARADLPEGPVNAITPARDYDDRAWVDVKGEPIPTAYHAARRIKAGEKDLAERIGSRDRRLRPIRIPPGGLRKGANVLALEIHRSQYHPVALKWFERDYRNPGKWVPLGLRDVRLEAVGSGAEPNVARPAGLQVWNVDVHDRLRWDDYGDPNEPLGPIRIVGARNGSFSGAVVLSGTQTLKNVRARAEDLVRAGGGSIPASAVEVFYVLPGKINRFRQYYEHWAYDVLSPAAPSAAPPRKERADPRKRTALGLPAKPVPGAVLPIWMKVHVPADAAPGDYRAALKLSADGMEPISVPVELHVAGWMVPEPRRFRTYVGMYQSPTSLSLRYKVPEWSEAHWRLMHRSFALLGQVGSKIVNIPLVDQTQFGNEEGMVRWVRKPDLPAAGSRPAAGNFEYDFTVLDRYLRLVKKHLDVPEFVVLHVWHAAGWHTRKPDQKNTVTVIEKAATRPSSPQANKREHMQVPPFGTAESTAFWRPVLTAVKERLAEAGMEKSMCLGVISDPQPPPEVVRQFAELLPGVGWMRGAHRQTWATNPVPMRGGGKVVLWEFVYGLGIADPAKRLPAIWSHPRRPGAAFIRSAFDDLPPMGFRTLPERALYCRTRGLGRLCLDYFLLGEGRKRHQVIFNRYPHSSVAQRQPTIYHLAAPGPDGPLPTVRFELLREGLQEAEAAITVAEAQARHPERLGQDLAGRCRRVFAERINFARTLHGVYAPAALHYTGWQERSQRLYQTAGEVTKALEGTVD